MLRSGTFFLYFFHATRRFLCYLFSAGLREKMCNRFLFVFRPENYLSVCFLTKGKFFFISFKRVCEPCVEKKNDAGLLLLA